METVTGNLRVEEYMELVKGGVPVMVDFYADWCEPCVMLDEILTELESGIPELRVLKVDVDQQPGLLAHFGFRSVPWLLLYYNGEEVWRMNGFMMAPDLMKIIKQHTHP